MGIKNEKMEEEKFGERLLAHKSIIDVEACWK